MTDTLGTQGLSAFALTPKEISGINDFRKSGNKPTSKDQLDPSTYTIITGTEFLAISDTEVYSPAIFSLYATHNNNVPKFDPIKPQIVAVNSSTISVTGKMAQQLGYILFNIQNPTSPDRHSESQIKTDLGTISDEVTALQTQIGTVVSAVKALDEVLTSEETEADRLYKLYKANEDIVFVMGSVPINPLSVLATITGILNSITDALEHSQGIWTSVKNDITNTVNSPIPVSQTMSAMQANARMRDWQRVQQEATDFQTAFSAVL